MTTMRDIVLPPEVALRHLPGKRVEHMMTWLTALQMKVSAERENLPALQRKWVMKKMT